MTATSAEGGRVAGSLRRGLSSFDTINFIARAPVGGEAGMHLRTDYVFHVSDGPTEGVHLELQNVLSGKVLLSRSLRTEEYSQAELEDHIADLLTSVAPVSGVIYAGLAEDGAHTMLTSCLQLNEMFYRDQNAHAHRAAYECLEELGRTDFRATLV